MAIEGEAELVQERDAIARVADLMNARYGGTTAEFLAALATIQVGPRRAFGIAHEDITRA